MKLRILAAILALGLAQAPLWADWKQEIGFTRLQLLAGAELPTSPTMGATQVEAFYPNTTHYAPDTSSPLFTGKTFTPNPGASATSSHAQHVAENFYGTASLLPGACDVHLYDINTWVNSGFLNYGGSAPNLETLAVQNHSWAGSFLDTAIDTQISRRLDYAIDRDGFVCAVGLFNEDATHPVHAQLLCQTYHTISVGRDDGLHTKGLTTLDGIDRMKPDIVAPSASPEDATSWTTPMVAGAAGLLHKKLVADHTSLPNADKPRVIKALLLASATKNTVPGWGNTSARPLDDIYGAGELNLHHAYLALCAGKKTAGTTPHGIRGWAAESVGTNAKTYYFNIPAGAPSTPFSAALTWHRSITALTWSPAMANLSLTLRNASNTVIATSASTTDNVELIHQNALPPGNYSLAVSKLSGSSTPYALAWHSLPAVTVAATSPTAREIDGQTGSVTFTRTGDTTLPLYVPLSIGGTAVAGSHYQALPANITIPAGQTTATLQITPISDFLAQGDRSVTLAVAADFAIADNPTQSAVVTIQDKPFDEWRSPPRFTSQELTDPTISGENADPDGDQLPNLVEYALNLAPKTPDLSPVAMIDSSGYLALSAPKNLAATDITWAAETSGTLTAWTPATLLTNTSTSFLARDTVLKTSASRRFIRLKILRP